MPGHRRISTELFLNSIAGKRKLTRTEMLLSLDYDVARDIERSTRAYGRTWGCTERTVRLVRDDYKSHRGDIDTSTKGRLGAALGADPEQQNCQARLDACKIESSTGGQDRAALGADPEQHSYECDPNENGRGGESDAADNWHGSQHTLTTAQVDKLVAIRPGGIEYTREQFIAWYIDKAPEMVAAEKRNLYATARNWWKRLRPGEVDASIAALGNRNFQDRFGNGEDDAAASTTAPGATPWNATA